MKKSFSLFFVIIVVLIVIFLKTSNSYAQDDRWVYVWDDKISNYYVNTYSITNVGNSIEMYVKDDIKDVPDYCYVLIKYKIFCDKKKFTIINALYFDIDGFAGQSSPPENIRIIDPGSLQEALFNFVCK